MSTAETRDNVPNNTEDSIVEGGKFESGDREPDIQRVLDELVPRSITSPDRREADITENTFLIKMRRAMRILRTFQCS